MVIKFDVTGLEGKAAKITLDGKQVDATKYEKDGKLFYEVKDSSGNVINQLIDLDHDNTFDQTVSFSYKNGKLESKTILENLDDKDGDDRKTVITYDKTGKKITGKEVDLNNDGVVDRKYTYENGEVKTKEVDTDGDGKFDKKYTYENGKVTTKSYDTDGDEKYDKTSAANQYEYYEGTKKIKTKRVDTDGDGKIDTICTYDKDGNITKKWIDTDGNGKYDSIYEYNYENGKLQSVDINKKGTRNDCTVTYTYDGNNKTATVTYKDKDGKVDNTDKRNHTTTYTLDDNGKVTSKEVKYPNNEKKNYSVKTEEKDQYGRVTKETITKNGETYTVEYTRDAFGRVIERKVDKEGEKNDYTTTYKRDVFGRLTSKETDKKSDDKIDYTTTYTRDDNGRVTKKEVKNASGKEKYTIEYEYDKKANGGLGSVKSTKKYPNSKRQVVTTIKPSGAKCVEKTDKEGKVTTKYYDKNGKEIEKTTWEKL